MSIENARTLLKRLKELDEVIPEYEGDIYFLNRKIFYRKVKISGSAR